MILFLSNSLPSTFLSREEFIFIFIALFLITLSIIFIITIFLSRLIKDKQQRKEKSWRERFQKIINALIINETFSTSKGAPNAAFEFHLAQLRNEMGSSRFVRQVLIDQLLVIKKSIHGISSIVLFKVYDELELYRISRRKLKSWSWKKKAQGIRELTEMDYKPAIDQVSKFLNARNQTLREESFMALVWLARQDPLFFLDEYRHNLTPWMRINIHYHLSALNMRKLPEFSRWFNHFNPSVVLFALSMANEFRQITAIPALVKLLEHPDTRISGLALKTLGEMEAYAYADVIAGMIKKLWKNARMCERIARALGKIAESDNHLVALERLLDHFNYKVRFEAAKALKTTGDAGWQRLLSYNNQKRNGSLSALVAHISEPLLQ